MSFSARGVFWPGTAAARWLVIPCIISILLCVHLWQERYFLRFIPLPLSWAHIVNENSSILPNNQPAQPNGKIDLPRHDITTEDGLRKTLNSFQTFSPVSAINGMPDYTEITFAKWVSEIQAKAFFCTDATQLFILAAWVQGLKVREWHLLSPGWPAGDGHSVAEFFNPVRGAWQLVDPQHATIIKDRKTGQILNMVEVLRRYKAGQQSEVAFDYGPYATAMSNGARGNSSEELFFKLGLLSTPVLQLRQATWFAEYAKTFLISGNFVIGYPIVVDAWTHHGQVLWTKLSLLGLLITGSIFLVVGLTLRRGRHDK